MQRQLYLLLFISILLLLIGTIYTGAIMGMGLTPDSITYLACAKHVAVGKGFLSFDGYPLQNWAPLYALALSPAYVFSIPAETWASSLQLIAIIGALILSMRQMIQESSLRSTQIWLFIILIPGIFLKLSITLYSEPLFIFFQAVFWMFFFRYLHLHRKPDLLKAAIAMGFMCLQRYAGFMLFGISILIVLTQGYSKAHLKHVLVFVWIVILMNSWWFIHNYQLSQSITGHHHVYDKLNVRAFGSNMYRILVELQQHILRFFAYATVLFFWIISVVFIQKRCSDEKRKIRIRALWFYCSAYFFLLLLQRNLHLFELARYVSVIYLPLSMYAALFAGEWLTYYGDHGNNRKFVHITCWVLGLIQAIVFLHESIYVHTHGAGYNGESWHRLHIPDSVLALHPMSNYPDYLWLKSGQTQTFFKYKNEVYSDFLQRTNGNNTYLWINHPMRQTIQSCSELAPVDSFAPLIQTREWILYSRYHTN